MNLLFSHDRQLTSIKYNSNLDYFIVGTAHYNGPVWDGEILIFDSEFKSNFKIGNAHGINSIDCAYDGNYIIGATNIGDVVIYRINNTTQVEKYKSQTSFIGCFSEHDDVISCVRTCPQKSTLFVSSSYDCTMKVWDIVNPSNNETLVGHSKRITGCDWSVLNNMICSVSDDCKTKIWNVKDYSCISTIESSIPYTSCLWPNNDNNALFLGNIDGVVELHDIRKANVIVSSNNDHKGLVRCLHETKGFIFSGSDDTSIIQHNIPDLNVVNIFKQNQDYISSICSKDNKIYSTSWDKTINVISL